MNALLSRLKKKSSPNHELCQCGTGEAFHQWVSMPAEYLWARRDLVSGNFTIVKLCDECFEEQRDALERKLIKEDIVRIKEEDGRDVEYHVD